MFDISDLFQKYKKIAIYGLSNVTKKVLDQISKEISIIGLLDGYKEDGELYGLPIISIEKAIQEGVELILVVARPGSCKAIAQRIGKTCSEHQIELLDIRGNDLCNPKQIVYHFQNVNGITKKQLWQKIEPYSVISIDLFDTLIMRQVLFSTDVFELVDLRLKQQGIFINDFCGKRLESEKFLAKEDQVMLEEIYDYMIKHYQIPNVHEKQLAELEWKIDYELLVPRKEVCEFMEQVQKSGKNIYIVSDTYYTKNQIKLVLDKCNIFFYADIFASCEYGTAKTQKLFEKVREKLEIDSWIHIGDDIVADIECARTNRIECCQLYSGIDLLDKAGYLGLWQSADKICNRIKIGMFTAKLFNSPFQFETEASKISVIKAYDLGYLFFAPVITDFVLWFAHQMKEENIRNIWFGARDGYLIKKMYDLLVENSITKYFLTSRTAAVRAGMENEDDIRYVTDMKFSGSLQEQMADRFGIQINSAEFDTNAEEDILQYSGLILEASRKMRENYKKYLRTLEPEKKTDIIAFFDFVAKGTTQMFLRKLVSNHMKGFYFLQLEEEQMRDKPVDIVAFYSNQEREKSTIFDDYYVLETMLTAPEASVLEFDKKGKPVYAIETRKKQDIDCFMEAQQGILDYFKTYLKLCPNEVRLEDKVIDEAFLKMIHGVKILDERFLKLNVEDPFFNRMTKITDVL